MKNEMNFDSFALANILFGDNYPMIHHLKVRRSLHMGWRRQYGSPS